MPWTEGVQSSEAELDQALPPARLTKFALNFLYNNHRPSTTMPMDRTPIKIPGKNTRDTSKAAVAARKALVRTFCF